MVVWFFAGILALAAMVTLQRSLGRRSGPDLEPWRVFGAIMAGLAAAAAGLSGRWALAPPLLAIAAGLLTPVLKRAPSQEPTQQPPSDGMSEAEARAILGLDEGAKPKEIQAAYRRLMARAHPDAGGSDRLAAMVDAAKRRLLDG